MQTIPIANIYYLLSYAWDRLDEQGAPLVSAEETTSLQDLFARILEVEVGRLLKRGLARTYVEHSEEIAGVRGRIDLAASVKRTTLSRAAAVCVFDELSSDTTANRIIKATLRNLARVGGLDAGSAERLRELFRRVVDVRDIALDETCFREAARQRPRGAYVLLLDVCEVVYRNLLVDERTGQVTFRDFTRDDRQMAALFERFLLRFYSLHQQRYRVSAPQLRWSAMGASGDVAFLPLMRTDICLRNRESIVVMDAKYHATTLTERFGKQTIRSGHLYQLFSYMHHLSLQSPAARVSGVLIYPRTTSSVCVQVELSGYPVKVVAIDLSMSSSQIHNDLLMVLDEAAPTGLAQSLT